MAKDSSDAQTLTAAGWRSETAAERRRKDDAMSTNVHVEESVRIDRPPDEVWNAIANYAFDLDWRKGLKEMTPDPEGPPAPGTKVHEVVRNSGRDYVADTVVTQLDPGASYRFEGSGTIGGVAGGRAVHAAQSGNGAVFTYTIDLQPKGAMRLLGPLLGPMVRSGLRKDLAKLKGLLDNGGQTAAGADG
jgi:carbon monoxide dehydrogenase subunit G